MLPMLGDAGCGYMAKQHSAPGGRHGAVSATCWAGMLAVRGPGQQRTGNGVDARFRRRTHPLDDILGMLGN